MNEQIPAPLQERIAHLSPRAPAPPALSPRTRAAILAVDRGILHVARHWLLAVNVLGGIVAALPLLAPWLLAHGARFPARAIFLAFRLICHQRPDRSFFVFGQQMAYCERNTAMYTGVFALGLGYALVRGHLRPLRPLRWRWMFLLWVPMALDGFTQLFGWRESTWELRVVTGALFALACAWVGFPLLERACGEMRDQLEARFARGTDGAAIGAR
jgi:uncharacterized membrane protein